MDREELFTHVRNDDAQVSPALCGGSLPEEVCATVTRSQVLLTWE